MSSQQDPSPHPAKTQTCQNIDDNSLHLHKPHTTNHLTDHTATSTLVTSDVILEDTGAKKDTSSQQADPLPGKNRIQVYGRRWYVLAVFCLGAVIQGAGLDIWDPITQSSKLVFSWTDGYVALQPLWGDLAFIVVIGPVTWLMDVKGLRVSMLFSSAVMAVGFGLRCITSEPHAATWLINVSQIVIGVGGVFPFSGTTLLSVTWFPPSERATATAIASVFVYIGNAIAFVIGPEVVPEPPTVTSVTPTSVTPAEGSSTPWAALSSSSSEISIAENLTDAVDLSRQRDAIMRLMYYEAGAAGLLLLVVVIYFPDAPPLPPSHSAAVTRTEYMAGLQALARNSKFWILTMAYSLPVGTYEAFMGVLDIDLNHTGMSEMLADWLGFYAVIGGCVSGLLVCRIADLFMRRLKLLLLLLYVGAAVSLVWFCLLVLQYIPFNIPSVYATAILTGVFVNGSIPLFYEEVCEVSYPVAEGLTTGAITVVNNVVGVIFLGVLLVPGIGVAWMNWVLLASVLAALPLLLMVRQHYGRTDLDVPDAEPA